ncbi:LacI family transcriptional regulator, partial [Streptomyces sp. SID7499]|nr:LacI family transcriptional regulator [Streptomyces sp. SID7499]
MSAPTVYDVAERSGVSIATVSRVYRNPDSVRAQTREKVMEAARELGYVPSGSARG